MRFLPNRRPFRLLLALLAIGAMGGGSCFEKAGAWWFSGWPSGMSPSSRVAASSQSSRFAIEVVREVNRFRAQNNLPPLSMDTRLNRAAQRHSNDMARRNAISHHCGDGTTVSERIAESGYRWRTIAENVAAGQITPREVVRDWINSPGHRANLLKPAVTDAGVGYSNGFWTLDLAG